MSTKKATTQITRQFFITKRLTGAIHMVFAVAVALTILGIGLLRAGAQSETLADGSQFSCAEKWHKGNLFP